MSPKIQQEIEKLLRSAGVTGEIVLSPSPKREMGDFAFPCFSIAKEQKINPAEAAKSVAAKISHQSGIVNRAEAFGPYVNFYLNSAKVAGQVVGEVLKNKEKFGINKTGKGLSVLIEYPSNNTHKEFHVGHLRNVCIGNPLVNLYRANGYAVYAVNYLNDFGAHVAKCLWGLLKFHGDQTPPKNKQKWLGNIYVESSRYVREHPETEPEVAELQKKLEAHDKKLWPLFEKTRKWSIEKFSELFKELAVKHAAVFYEKDIKQAAQRTVDEMLKKKIAKVGEGGAIIIDLSGFGLDIALLRKSNGAGLYLTSDLPLAKEKFKKFNVDESIVITGQEQDFYFRQLYKILELMGFKKKLTHIGYGLVNTPEGKMSSRAGNVILYEDLRDEVYKKIYSETKNRHDDWNEREIAATSKILTMAALKFDMQKHEAAKNIIFDPKEATSFEGFSGPYVLYAVARINSVLRKAKEAKIKPKNTKDVLVQPEEKKLALKIAEFEEVIKNALAEYNPSVVTRFCFDLAQTFNDFYNKHSVLSAENKDLINARLSLLLAVKQTLQNALGILTIGTVEEM